MADGNTEAFDRKEFSRKTWVIVVSGLLLPPVGIILSWPFMTLGDFGGTMQKGHYVQVENDRPINSFYATLLEATGNPVEHFNIGGAYEKYDTGKGSLRELLT